ncbi:MAG: hypothetical protein QXM73_03040 [Candidatus Nezhaarchaeales archaeon]
MPFTTYHFGPALLIGVFLWSCLHWPTLITASLIVDVEPLLAFTVLVSYPIHGSLHTFLASLIGGSLVGLFMYFIDRSFKRIYRGLALVKGDLGLKGYLVAGVIGWFIHVLYDTPLYYEMMPFYPLEGNPFYNSLPYPILHAFYVVLLCTGIAAYLVNTFKVSSNRCGVDHAMLQAGLLLVVAATLLLLSFDVLMLFLATIMIAGGIIVVHTSLLKLVKQWKTRIMLSMLCMLIAIIAFTVIAALSLSSLKVSIEVLLDTFVNLPTVFFAALWISVLTGLMLLRRPLIEASSTVRSHLTFILILGWVLTPAIIGILVFWITLVIMAARIGETKYVQ